MEDFTQEKRIYVIIPETVQNPVGQIVGPGGLRQYVIPKDAMTTIQPCGRMGAQVGHVERKMGETLLKRNLLELLKNYDGHASKFINREVKAFANEPYVPMTTIVLTVRDSLELFHIATLMDKSSIEYLTFLDTNDQYGPGEVATALCTFPIEPHKLIGITDYLPLWNHGQNK